MLERQPNWHGEGSRRLSLNGMPLNSRLDELVHHTRENGRLAKEHIPKTPVIADPATKV